VFLKAHFPLFFAKSMGDAVADRVQLQSINQLTLKLPNDR